MPERWTIHTLVLDLDDTLYPEREYVLSGFRAVADWLREELGETGFEAEALRLYAAGHRGSIFDEALAITGTAADADLIENMVSIYRSHRPALNLYPDAEDILDWSARVGLRTALITDGFTAVQRAKIAALGIHDRISCCIVTDELGGRQFWKPHPEAYLRVMAEHLGRAAGYVYIADNPRKDFVAPRTLGWRTLRIRRENTEHGNYYNENDVNAELDIRSLAEAKQLLDPDPS